MIEFDGAVLCGGSSRRMGRDKALLEVDAEAMVSRVAAALMSAGAVSASAVGGDGAEITALGLDFVPDRWPGEGPLGGLVSTLDAVGSKPIVLVLSCDLLHPDPAEMRRLVERLDSSPADAVIPRVRDRAQWLHGAWRRRVAGVLEDVFDSGERSLFGAASGLEIEFVEVASDLPYADADTPLDLPGID